MKEPSKNYNSKPDKQKYFQFIYMDKSRHREALAVLLPYSTHYASTAVILNQDPAAPWVSMKSF